MGVEVDSELLIGLIGVFATVFGVSVGSVYTVFKMLREDVQKYDAKLDGLTNKLHDHENRIRETERKREYERWAR